MDPVAEKVPQREVNGPLALQPGLPLESGRLDFYREMALAAAVMAGMAAMPVAVVDHLKARRSERFTQAFVDFGGDRAG